MHKLNTEIDFHFKDWPYVHDTMSPGSQQFYGPDNEKLYQRNLKYQDLNWVYRDKKISYNFNSLGLRMDKELSDVDKEFIYFSGTSFSMGIGVATEDRFSELLSKDLNLDFLNYAGPTYTIKIQVLSFFNYLKEYQKPKILIIEYPPSHAYTFFKQKQAIMYYSKHKPNTEYNMLYNQMLGTDFFVKEAEIYSNLLKTLCKECNIRLIEISFHPQDPFALNSGILLIDPDFIDPNNLGDRFARDITIQNQTKSAHPGIGVHRLAYKKIKEII